MPFSKYERQRTLKTSVGVDPPVLRKLTPIHLIYSDMKNVTYDEFTLRALVKFNTIITSMR